MLQQNGSHEPYSTQSPKKFHKFGTSNLKVQYLNSVYYTYYIISQIVDAAKERFKDYTIFYSSDHGQHVTKTTGGKGSYNFKSNYLVPTFITTNNKQSLKINKNIFSKCKHIFHVQISEAIAFLMGYDVKNSGCKDGFVANKTLTGNNGYLHIFDNNGTLEEKNIYQ